jgi:hypothetical protein
MRALGLMVAIVATSVGVAAATPTLAQGKSPAGTPGPAYGGARGPGHGGAPGPGYGSSRGPGHGGAGVYWHGGRGPWHGPGVRLYVGSPFWWGVPYAYGAPWSYRGPLPYAYGYGYAPPAIVTAPPSPLVYVERDQVVSTATPAPAAPPAASAPGASWWYLCASPRGAYPYVRECPGGWERVPAVPPGETQ